MSTAPSPLNWEQIDLNPAPQLDIQIHMFLDKSGSMQVNWPQTITGVKEYFNGLKAQNTDYTVSLHAFAQRLRTVFDKVKIADVDLSLIDPIVADGTSTSLYDSMAEVLSGIHDEVNPFLIVVFTDGMDNSSRSYKAAGIRELINRLEAQNNFTFVFMGAAPDAWGEAANLGTTKGNTSLFDRQDTIRSFMEASASTQSYARGVRAPNSFMRSTRNFYGRDEDAAVPTPDLTSVDPNDTTFLITILEPILIGYPSIIMKPCRKTHTLSKPLL